jgi:hypothetical protein
MKWKEFRKNSHGLIEIVFWHLLERPENHKTTQLEWPLSQPIFEPGTPEICV